MITVYSKPNCGQCTATYRALDSKGIEFNVVDVSADPEALAKIKDLGYLAAPVVVVNENTHWAGFRPDQISQINRRDHAAATHAAPERAATVVAPTAVSATYDAAYRGGSTTMTDQGAVIMQSNRYDLNY